MQPKALNAEQTASSWWIASEQFKRQEGKWSIARGTKAKDELAIAEDALPVVRL